jgi:hypothetical protein
VGLLDFLKGKGAPSVKGRGEAPGAPAPEARPAVDLGCLLCGEELVAAAGARPAACVLCGAARPPSQRCSRGHAACAACLAGAPRDVVERVCAATPERDPVALALRLLELPALRAGGADHGFLVPAVLIATWANATGRATDRAALVAEARRRAATEPGCRDEGHCGAAQGAGTFVAIAAAARPGGDDGALAARMAARAASLVGESGSRCCKRDSLLSLLAAARFAREHLDAELPAQGIGCERSGRSAECMGSGCPFNR